MRALAIGWLAIAIGCGRPSPPPAAALPVAPTAPAPPAVRRAPAWAGIRFDAASTKILRVIPGSPAERAGLRAGDEITTLAGRATTRSRDLAERIRALAPQTTVTVGVRRTGTRISVQLTVEERPDLHAVVWQALVGRPAPSFGAELVRGAYPARLADLAGQVVVVDFWATWCGPCATTMPHLDAWQTKYGGQGLRIVGLSNEELPEIQRYLDSHELAYTIARDPGAAIGQDYLLQGVPMLVVIDRAGIVRYVAIGAGGFDATETAITRLL